MTQAVDISFVLLTEAFSLGIPNAQAGGMHLLSAIEKTRELGVPASEKTAPVMDEVDNDASLRALGAMMGNTGFGGAIA